MRRFRVVVNGLVYEVGVEELDEGGPPPGTVSAPPAPQATAPRPSEEVPPRRQHGHAPAAAPAPPRSAPAAGGEVITAPLPGTVLDLKVATGDHVKTGQVLLVLEAMKMENEIVAPKDGTVEEILVKKGSAVTTGDPLVRIG